MIGVIPLQTLSAELSSSNFDQVTSDIFEDVTAPRQYLLHVKPGAVVYGRTLFPTQLPGLTISALPVGSRMILANDGAISGSGGAGGGAGGATCSTNTAGNGSGGSDGGVALELENDVIIDNVNGTIYGGGGGGGGGGGCVYQGGAVGCGGGGGGGGQGYNVVAGGPRGTVVCANVNNGTTGGSGTVAGAGAGGSGTTTSVFGQNVKSGAGGAGGAWGAAATAGDEGTSTIGASNSGDGGAAGAGGNSITKNGNTLNWLSGSANIAGSIGA